MNYRTFGRLDWRPSALGFGAMRLPVHGDESGRGAPGSIDEAVATAMLHYAVDHGVNYVDTAYVYHQGTSEGWLGRALAGGYRERVHVATKLPLWNVTSLADCDRILDEQRERLGTATIDFYLLHGLNRSSWQKVVDLGVLAWCERALADGRIGHLGFSFHDDFALFEEVVAATDLWEFCQIQYNYMDEDAEPGRRGLHLAAERGLGVIVMEPLRGGLLTARPPEAVARLWAAAPVRRTPAEWALQWVWDQPEVSLVLSGMSTLAQVEQNVAAAAAAATGPMTAAELATIAAVRDAYRGLTPIDCTQCGYCAPCPSGVDIPACFGVYNDAHIYGNRERSLFSYGWIAEAARADRCTRCGECETRCPQQLPIGDWLEKVADFFA